MSLGSHIKTILFLLTSLVVGIGIGKGYLEWKRHNSADFSHKGDPPLVTGTGDAPDWRGFVVHDPATLPAVIKAAQGVFATNIGFEYLPDVTRS